MSARDPTDLESESARAFLESLQRDRGTKLLPEADYQEMRQAVLTELMRGPRVSISTLMTFGLVGLILFGFLIIGLVQVVHYGLADWPLAGAAGIAVGLWAYFLRQYLAGIRQQARFSLRERLEEIEELRRHGLITQPEFEQIFAAIHSSRGVPLEPDRK